MSGEGLRDECGVFGILGNEDAANLTYLGLYALQHRGQESAGIVSWDGARLHRQVGMGHVAEVFSPDVLAELPGAAAIGHVRYSTAGASFLANAQPILVNTNKGPVAIAHNGNLVNAALLRQELEARGSIFATTSDTEVILHLLALSSEKELEDALGDALRRAQGAYSLVLIAPGKILAARDPFGWRPLSLGQLSGAVCVASETCAFDLINARPLREVEPGEMVIVTAEGIAARKFSSSSKKTQCVFEHVYFARPDSMVFGGSVAASRRRLGEQLAREAPAVADAVVPVPDSGVFAAIGYSRASGIPLEFGLIRNHYVGRTFIEPKQSIRNFGVKVKLNPVRELIAGQRIVLIDDSLVRGTTSRKIVGMMRAAGAREVHMRISSPPMTDPCYYGIDTPRRDELIAAAHSVAEIQSFIEADSLAYLSLEGMLTAVGGTNRDYCSACFTGKYPQLGAASTAIP